MSEWREYLDISESESVISMREPLAANQSVLTATPQAKHKRPAQNNFTPSSAQQNVVRRKIDEEIKVFDENGLTPTRPTTKKFEDGDGATPDTIVSLRNGIGIAARKIEEERQRQKSKLENVVSVPSSDVDESLDDVSPDFTVKPVIRAEVSLDRLISLKREMAMRHQIRQLKDMVEFLELERTFERSM